MRMLGCALLAGALLIAPLARADQAADARKTQLDRLFKALQAAPDETAAAMLETRIRTLWTQQATAAVVLLLARADRELAAGDYDEALADYDAVLVLQPDFAEGYDHRAAARAAVGDTNGAVRDIEAALARDPRDFAAWQGLSHIAEQQGNWTGALKAWQRALDIDPRTPGGMERLDRLQKKVEGEST